jgi:hypothetical protein
MKKLSAEILLTCALIGLAGGPTWESFFYAFLAVFGVNLLDSARR